MHTRIVILSAFITPFRSGAEACAEEVPAALWDRFDATIVTARLRRDVPKKDTLQGVPVIRVGIGHPLDKWLFPFLAPFVVRKLKPKIVHAVLESYAGMAMVFCKLIVPSAKRMLTCQSTNTSLFLGMMHRSAHCVTVISSVLLDRARSFGRMDTVLIPNGIRYDDIRSACERREKVPGRVLFVGRLEPVKGVETLLRAFANVASQKADRLILHIVGDGSQRKMLEETAMSLGIADRVHFQGYVPSPELFDAFAEAEIFCGLSRSEAQGNVFLEAQAAGCAVLATRVGGIPDTVQDGTTGVLVSPDDTSEAEMALSILLTDEGLRTRLQRAGIENARSYDWVDIAKRYGDCYMKLIG